MVQKCMRGEHSHHLLGLEPDGTALIAIVTSRKEGTIHDENTLSLNTRSYWALYRIPLADYNVLIQTEFLYRVSW